MKPFNSIPQVITDYIAAANKPDPAAFLACFAEDAVVLDEAQERHGKAAIKKWSDEYHFGANVTLAPKEVRQEDDEIIVTCEIDGDYDKTDLPDPLLLDYHFRIQNDKIISLSIY